MVKVQKRAGESEDRLISRFRKKILNDGKLLEIRDKERYMSKSQRKKERKYRLKHENELAKKRNY